MADYISTLQILSFLGHVPVVIEVLAFKGKSNSSDTNIFHMLSLKVSKLT